ncbi:MAG TPA: tRNA guanosine(34) transglycosylase Tgt [Bacteroidota bacterium]|nr:tRNA guanosine(34) transglycosylase Tgt [Bacteroidota bacterium]
MRFTVEKTDAAARAGRLETDHGVIETPIFMPVGTQGSVKAVEQRELKEAGAQIILGNSYHLYLRPGLDVLRRAGGLHKFMNWNLPILTDSGGYQVFSLSDLRKISEEGVTFKSHLDGSTHMFTPRKVVEIQRAIGSDIMMVLDECTPFPCEHEYALASNLLTVKWAKECREASRNEGAGYGHSQALFAIVQGSVFHDVRRESASALTETGFEGYAIGGLAVGEPTETMYELAGFTAALLPAEAPRYLMGVGTPQDILECIERGVDMFDCVMPTRNGRNAMVFTRHGRLNLTNARFRDEDSPVDEECECYACRSFTRAYLRHLFIAKEILALQLASVHNLTFYLWLVREARKQILEGRYSSWKNEMIHRLS